MIARVVTAAGAVVPVAAAGAGRIARTSAAQSVPVVWSILGEPFEAASMIAALFGCLAARFWIGAGQQARKQHRWMLDVPVSGMALATSATLVMQVQPVPFTALLYGAGLGVMGETIFKIAEKYLPAFGAAPTPPDTTQVGATLQAAHAKTAREAVPDDMHDQTDRLS